MLAEERRQKLSEIVSKRGYVPLLELVEEMAVSESTVRRDLDFLHETGLVRRTHGGAIAVGGGNLPPFEERRDRQAREKSRIGHKMASLIHDGETVLLDGGTTTLEVAKHLLHRSLQVVTNSLPIANLLASSREIDLLLLGGYVYPKTGVALGTITQEAMKHLHVDRLVLGVAGITERGLFNGNVLLVETERAMITCAKETDVVADHTKFGRPAIAFLADWSPIERLIVDDGATPEQLALVGHGVEVVMADGPAKEVSA